MTLLDAGPGWELWDSEPTPEYTKNASLVTKVEKGWLIEWWY